MRLPGDREYVRKKHLRDLADVISYIDSETAVPSLDHKYDSVAVIRAPLLEIGGPGLRGREKRRELILKARGWR